MYRHEYRRDLHAEVLRIEFELRYAHRAATSTLRAALPKQRLGLPSSSGAQRRAAVRQAGLTLSDADSGNDLHALVLARDGPLQQVVGEVGVAVADDRV